MCLLRGSRNSDVVRELLGKAPMGIIVSDPALVAHRVAASGDAAFEWPARCRQARFTPLNAYDGRIDGTGGGCDGLAGHVLPWRCQEQQFRGVDFGKFWIYAAACSGVCGRQIMVSRIREV